MSNRFKHSLSLADPETTESKFKRSQPLKLCDQCGKHADPQGGVEMRSKWFCARCWMKHLARR